MPVYRPDPGGVFESDTHRRVLAALPFDGPALQLEYAIQPVLADENTPFLVPNEETFVDFKAVVDDLVAEDYAVSSDAGVKRTPTGASALAAPDANEPPPLGDEMVAAREAENEKQAQTNAVLQAKGRIEAAKAAIEEYEEGIAEDEAVIAEFGDRPDKPPLEGSDEEVFRD